MRTACMERGMEKTDTIHPSPGRRRWNRFKQNKRGYYSLLIFGLFFCVSLCSEVISNDVPFLVIYNGGYYFPLLKAYPETVFGGVFETETDYQDPFFLEQMGHAGNHAFFPFNRHGYNSINLTIDGPLPSPPTQVNMLGTDDRGRDVLARLLYGFRLSVLFGFCPDPGRDTPGDCCRGDAGILWRKGGSVFPEVYRDLGFDAGIVSAHYFCIDFQTKRSAPPDAVIRCSVGWVYPIMSGRSS